jgi:hypothetical protein
MAQQIWLATSGHILGQRKILARSVTGYSKFQTSYDDLNEATPRLLTSLDYQHEERILRKGREEFELADWGPGITRQLYKNSCQGLSVALKGCEKANYLGLLAIVTGTCNKKVLMLPKL